MSRTSRQVAVRGSGVGDFLGVQGLFGIHGFWFLGLRSLWGLGSECKYLCKQVVIGTTSALGGANLPT